MFCPTRTCRRLTNIIKYNYIFDNTRVCKNAIQMIIILIIDTWVRWCYCCAGELRFGPHQLKSSAGVQQGDPLGPLLFSLVLLDLLDQVGQIEGLRSSVWYLDDGTFVGPRSSMVSLIDRFQQLSPPPWVSTSIYPNVKSSGPLATNRSQNFHLKCVIYPSLMGVLIC